MENTTGDHELTNHYRKLVETSASLYSDLKSLIHMKEGRPTVRPKENSQDTRTTKLLKCLTSAGIAVCPNKHKTSEGMTPNRQAKKVEHFYPNINLQTWDRTKCHNALCAALCVALCVAGCSCWLLLLAAPAGCFVTSCCLCCCCCRA
jgi:hypothetical protein